jgi:hypothetical protein
MHSGSGPTDRYGDLKFRLCLFVFFLRNVAESLQSDSAFKKDCKVSSVRSEKSRARIVKLLRSPRIDSNEPIPSGCVAWRLIRQTYSYLVPSRHKFQHSTTGYSRIQIPMAFERKDRCCVVIGNKGLILTR